MAKSKKARLQEKRDAQQGKKILYITIGITIVLIILAYLAFLRTVG